MWTKTASGVWGLALGALIGCEDGSPSGEGDLRVQLTGEETISEGLDPGPDQENTEDYAVRFDKYLAVVGDVEIARSRSGERRQLPTSYVVDMIGTGEAGFALGEITGLASGVWDKFSFRTPAADAATERGPRVSQEDYDEMVAGGLTYYIVGRVLREESAGGEVEFRLKLGVPTQFSECSFEGEGGVSVTADGTSTATITLHGDHLFFNAFPAAAEGTIRRMAAWITECDLDGDGIVDNDELAQMDASDLFTQAKGYSLSGAPIPVETALDFARAQLASQGHFRGEGECVWELEE
ncbi:MAG TPA: hypothetical protein VFZ61_01665 [Polyangiales bacterium]